MTHQPVNLVPENSSGAPHYFCTWSSQGYDQESAGLSDWCSNIERLTEQNLFGDQGWATTILGNARKDFSLMLDVGWDVEPGQYVNGQNQSLGTMMLSEKKFPSCTGTPSQRLAALNKLARGAGWKAAALWVAPHLPGESDTFTATDDARRAYYQERARWCVDAGISYWKVDVGHRGSVHHRRLMTEAARDVSPTLILEHSQGLGPVNDEITPWDTTPTARTGRFGEWRTRGGRVLDPLLELITFSDVLRSYDVSPQLSVATTLDRAACLLARGKPAPGTLGLLNVEDEPYLAAGLGCVIGMMRHTCFRLTPEAPFDPYQTRHRMDEMIRAARWSRIAPPMPVGSTALLADSAGLTDTWFFRKGDGWMYWFFGQAVDQGAPARVSRGMPLPMVSGYDKIPPYVVASRYPNGATAVATLPRTQIDGSITTPLCDVAIEITDWTKPVGVFGTFRNLKLSHVHATPPKRVWAQDLAAAEAMDVSDAIHVEGRDLLISGENLHRWGLSGAQAGDISDPALVLQFVHD